MGNCGSKPDVDAIAPPPAMAAAPPPAPPPAASPPAAAAPAPKEKPAPQIFALSRNGHEVIRGAMKECDALCDDLALFATNWHNLKHWMDLHALMEDGNDMGKGLFALLEDKWPGIAAPLSALHPQVHDKEVVLEEAIKSGDVPQVKSLWQDFMPFNEDHLKMEEDVMMPKVMAMAKEGLSLKTIMKDDLLCCVPASEMEFFVGFAMKMLEKYPTADDGAVMPRARVWSHALSTVASEEEWKVWHPYVKASLSPELYAKIKAEVEWGDC